MTVLCSHSHSEYDHAQDYGTQDYRRFFDPEEEGYQCAVQAELPSEPWTFLACPERSRSRSLTCTLCGREAHTAHRDAIVISVDGACRGNGTPYAESGIGVFFHRDSAFNRAKRVRTPYAHTSQRAELHAGLEALTLAREIWGENPRKGTSRSMLPPPGPLRKLRRVVVRADSKYLVDGMSSWIFKWRENGYRNCRGTEVVNGDLFQKLEGLVAELEGEGVDVQFWHVKRWDNSMADWLANAALDGKDVDEAVEEYFD